MNALERLLSANTNETSSNKQGTQMNLQNSIEEGEPYILVEGPEWGDAEFCGKWLLMAAKAEALWKKAINDPSLKEQIETLTAVNMPDFGIGAIVMVSQLEKNSCLLHHPARRRGSRIGRRFCDDGRNGIFRPHWPALPDGYPRTVGHGRGQKGRVEVCQN